MGPTCFDEVADRGFDARGDLEAADVGSVLFVGSKRAVITRPRPRSELAGIEASGGVPGAPGTDLVGPSSRCCSYQGSS